MPSTKLKVHKAQKEDRAIITGNVRRKFGEVTRSSWDMCKDRQRDRQTDEQTCSWQYSAPLPRGGVTVTWSGCRTDFHCALNVEMSGTTHSMLLLHLGHTQTHRQGSVQYTTSHTQTDKALCNTLHGWYDMDHTVVLSHRLYDLECYLIDYVTCQSFVAFCKWLITELSAEHTGKSH